MGVLILTHLSKIANKNTIMLDKTSVGIASELLVASKLIQHGCQVSLTLGHTKSVDIHASKNGCNYSIQVKGAQKNKSKSSTSSWRINSLNISNTVIYAFVNLNLNQLNLHEDIYLILGIDLKPLIKGNSPQGYIYSNTLTNYLNNWSII